MATLIAKLLPVLVVLGLPYGSTRPNKGRTTRSDDPDALQAVFEQLAERVGNLEAGLTDQRQLNTALQSRVSQLEEAASRRVVFTAAIDDATNPAASDDAIIPFTHVLTNVGNAYNPATSIFTAPLDGIYLFLIDVDVSPEYQAVWLKRNNDLIFAADKDDVVRTHLSGSGTITLRAGDVISLRHARGDLGHVEGGVDSTFTGILIN